MTETDRGNKGLHNDDSWWAASGLACVNQQYKQWCCMFDISSTTLSAVYILLPRPRLTNQTPTFFHRGVTALSSFRTFGWKMVTTCSQYPPLLQPSIRSFCLRVNLPSTKWACFNSQCGSNWPVQPHTAVRMMIKLSCCSRWLEVKSHCWFQMSLKFDCSCKSWESWLWTLKTFCLVRLKKKESCALVYWAQYCSTRTAGKTSGTIVDQS